MSNHIHLLVQEREENISDAMKRVGVIYAQYFNKKYQRSGHLFQDRFRSEPVESAEYFLTLLRYIHQNPLKAGLVEKVDDYKWSSWKEYKMDHVAAPLCATKPVLNHFSQQELTELVCTPIEAYNVLDIVTKSTIRNVLISSINEVNKNNTVCYDLVIKVFNKDDLEFFIDELKTLDFVTDVKRY